MIRTDNPILDAANYFGDMEDKERLMKKLEKRPCCLICGKEIKDPKCYVILLDGDRGFDSCICFSCKRKQTANLDYYLADILDESLSEDIEDTPIKYSDFGYNENYERYEEGA